MMDVLGSDVEASPLEGMITSDASSPLEHLSNLRLQIPLFQLKLASAVDGESDHADEAVVGSEQQAAHGECEVRYLLHTSDVLPASPLQEEYLSSVRVATVLQHGYAHVESAVEACSLRARDLCGYEPESEWIGKKPCVVCRSAPRDAECLPCMHRSCCTWCAKHVPRCPKCLGDIRGVRRCSPEDLTKGDRAPFHQHSPSALPAGAGLELPQPVASSPRPVYLDYTVHVPVELNPGLLMSAPLSFPHRLPLATYTDHVRFPPPLVISLIVRPATSSHLAATASAEAVASPRPAGEWQLAVGVRLYLEDTALPDPAPLPAPIEALLADRALPKRRSPLSASCVCAVQALVTLLLLLWAFVIMHTILPVSPSTDAAQPPASPAEASATGSTCLFAAFCGSYKKGQEAQKDVSGLPVSSQFDHAFERLFAQVAELRSLLTEGTYFGTPIWTLVSELLPLAYVSVLPFLLGLYAAVGCFEGRDRAAARPKPRAGQRVLKRILLGSLAVKRMQAARNSLSATLCRFMTAMASISVMAVVGITLMRDREFEILGMSAGAFLQEIVPLLYVSILPLLMGLRAAVGQWMIGSSDDGTNNDSMSALSA